MTSISRGLLLLSSMFSRKLDKNIFEGRPDLVNFRMANTGAAEFFIDVCALDTFIDK
jgi:hypothetical protein